MTIIYLVPHPSAQLLHIPVSVDISRSPAFLLGKMGVEPPFIYDRPSTYTFGGPTQRGFNPKAATQASWAPKPAKPKQEGPLIDFNKHPDTFVAVPYGNLNAEPMPPNTERRVTRSRQILLFVRICSLLGALGNLFCVIAVKKVATEVGWIIRAAPAVAVVHTLYGIYHLFKAAAGRTPGSTASYMVFAGVVDTGLIPFFVFSAWLAHAEYAENKYGWGTLFNDPDISYKIIFALFLLSCIETGLTVMSLIFDIYLGVKFRQIARLPPDLNPLEPNFTSRHKRNKSEGITEKNMRTSELASRREPQGTGFKRVPFIHTRTDSADSVTLYGSEAARTSRIGLRKEFEDNEKDPWRWSRTSSPTRPSSAVSPSPNSRAAGAGLEYRPERSSGLSQPTSRPASWLSYLDYEGVPNHMSDEATNELDHEVRPVSPVSALSMHDTSHVNMSNERENWYQGSGHNSQAQAVLSHNGGQVLTQHTNASRSRISQLLQTQSPPQPKRSREPLAMNPPSPVRGQFVNENIYSTGLHKVQASEYPPRGVLSETDLNGETRGNGGPRPASIVGSASKARSYGDLQSPAGVVTPHGDKKDGNLALHRVEDPYERTKTMQSESEYSTNFEVYTDDHDDDGRLSAHIGGGAPQGPWNGVRQASNSTGHDLNGGYAELGSEFGVGMGRRRDVSGKVAEEGRSSPSKNQKTKNGAAGWERFKGL
ncbi:hypothetical protein PV08_07244 [Exophiala spinifera]|uniref:Uncharacterized protein n=1 Tax=Exophiala spinifera TaxID=91928 RepID=A0A0D2B708_9EURO|nr:uncharacterized protein PV08_07244 [Exophiala spinifera]KIW14460.1 hypothetical protein PV08_07244 [Exophiala spinifera]